MLSINKNKQLLLSGKRGDVQQFRKLIQQGADVNSADSKGMTSMHCAAMSGHLDMITFLVLNYPKVILTRPNLAGRTPLILASTYGHLEIIKFLLSNGSDIHETDKEGHTALHLASQTGQLEIAQYLILSKANVNIRNNCRMTPLMSASACGHVNLVELLLCNDADINECDNDGLTGFHWASYEGHLEVVEYLYNRYPNACTKASTKHTAITLACAGGHLPVLKWLHSKKYNLEETDNDGQCGLHWACRYGHLDIAEYLYSHTEYQTLIKFKNTAGNTPLSLACCSGHLHLVKLLLDAGADLQQTGNLGLTGLHWACKGGHLNVVEYLVVEHKARIDTKTGHGHTGLALACKAGHFNVVQWLLGRGADVHTRDSKGRTGLHLACYNGNLNVVREMIRNGADLEALTTTGESPLTIAVKKKRQPIVSYIEVKLKQTKPAPIEPESSDHVESIMDIQLSNTEVFSDIQLFDPADISSGSSLDQYFPGGDAISYNYSLASVSISTSSESNTSSSSSNYTVYGLTINAFNACLEPSSNKQNGKRTQNPRTKRRCNCKASGIIESLKEENKQLNLTIQQQQQKIQQLKAELDCVLGLVPGKSSFAETSFDIIGSCIGSTNTDLDTIDWQLFDDDVDFSQDMLSHEADEQNTAEIAVDVPELVKELMLTPGEQSNILSTSKCPWTSHLPIPLTSHQISNHAVVSSQNFTNLNFENINTWQNSPNLMIGHDSVPTNDFKTVNLQPIKQLLQSGSPISMSGGMSLLPEVSQHQGMLSTQHVRSTSSLALKECTSAASVHKECGTAASVHKVCATAESMQKEGAMVASVQKEGATATSVQKEGAMATSVRTTQILTESNQEKPLIHSFIDSARVSDLTQKSRGDRKLTLKLLRELFTTDYLKFHTAVGDRNWPGLDKDKYNAIIDYVRSVYPDAKVSDLNTGINLACRDARNAKRKTRDTVDNEQCKKSKKQHSMD